MQFRPDPARKLSTNLYDIYQCCLYSEKTADDGQRNCPKHVKFYSKNKFLEISASSWFYCKNFMMSLGHLQWTVLSQFTINCTFDTVCTF